MTSRHQQFGVTWSGERDEELRGSIHAFMLVDCAPPRQEIVVTADRMMTICAAFDVSPPLLVVDVGYDAKPLMPAFDPRNWLRDPPPAPRPGRNWVSFNQAPRAPRRRK